MPTPQPAQLEIDALVRRSQECVRTADYEGAMDALRQAVAKAPTDAPLQALLDRTRKAAERHAASRDRQRAMRREADEIRTLLHDTSRGDGRFSTAHDRLRRAAAEHGRQAVFDELQDQLGHLVATGRQQRADSHFRHAQGRERAGDLTGALAEVEHALALESEIEGAMALRDRLRARLDDQAAKRRQALEVADAVQAVERWLQVAELDRAETTLAEAIANHGPDPALNGLGERLLAARRATEATRQGEWAERRLREAEDLVRSAAHDSLAGDFSAAVARLEAAERLQVDLPDLGERLETARQALERQQRQQAEAEAREAAVTQIRHRLDSLQLEAAADTLTEAEQRFGAHDRWTALRQRLDDLRDAASAAGILPKPTELKQLGIAARQAIRDREATFARAYGWGQVLSYPWRANGPFWLVVLAAGSLLATLASPAAGWAWMLASFLLIAPAVLRATLDGAVQPPSRPWADGGLRRDLASLTRLAPLALATLLPAIGLAIGHHRGGLPDGVTWPAMAAALWLACAVLVPAAACAVAFADASVWRLDHHAESWSEEAPHFAVLLAFVGLALMIVSRAVLAAEVPYLGPVVTGLVEAYVVLAVAHAIGVVVRGDRLAWAERYAR